MSLLFILVCVTQRPSNHYLVRIKIHICSIRLFCIVNFSNLYQYLFKTDFHFTNFLRTNRKQKIFKNTNSCLHMNRLLCNLIYYYSIRNYFHPSRIIQLSYDLFLHTYSQLKNMSNDLYNNKIIHP